MRFSIEGKEYEFARGLTVEEAMVMQDRAQLGIREFDAALMRGNPYAITVLVLLAKKRAGEAVRWQDLMGLDVLTFVIHAEPDSDEAPDEAEGSEGVERAPDPTSRGGRTRKAATSRT